MFARLFPFHSFIRKRRKILPAFSEMVRSEYSFRGAWMEGLIRPSTLDSVNAAGVCRLWWSRCKHAAVSQFYPCTRRRAIIWRWILHVRSASHSLPHNVVRNGCKPSGHNPQLEAPSPPPDINLSAFSRYWLLDGRTNAVLVQWTWIYDRSFVLWGLVGMRAFCRGVMSEGL